MAGVASIILGSVAAASSLAGGGLSFSQAAKQRKAQENMVDQERKGMEFEERLDFDKMKLESAEDQAGERIRIAEEKIDLAKEKQDGNKKTKN